MRLFFVLFCLLCTTTNGFAQEVIVRNKLTNAPITGVAIFNTDKSKSTVTSITGHVNLDKFEADEVIYFQHLSYLEKQINKFRIGKTGVVYLEPNTQGLDPIIISVSKFQQSRSDVPQKVLSVSAEDIVLFNPQTSADLLNNSGQVYIQKSQLGGGSPMIRGFSTNRLLITVDGVRMNNAIFRGGNLQNVISIDPFSLENTEVILGAGAVIHGSDAIGGVMSFYTQKPKLSYSDSLLFKANTITRYASANEEKTIHVDLNFGLKKWGFLTNMSYSDFNDLKMGSHGPDDYLRNEFIIRNNNQDIIVENDNPLLQRFSGYSQFSFLQKIHYEPYDNLNFDLGIIYSTTSDYSRYDRLLRYTDGHLRSSEWDYGPQRWVMINGQVTKLSSRSNLYDKLKATVAYQNFQESRHDRNYQSIIRNNREEAVDAYSFNLDLERTLSPKTIFFYGLEYVYNKVSSDANEENINTNIKTSTFSRYPNGSSWQSAAIYTSIKYKPSSKFVLQSGLRFNHINAKSSFRENNTFLNLPFESTEINAGALTGTAGIIWTPNKTIQWKLNGSSAFRAPNIDDIGKVFDSEPESVVVPNNNLKPEYAYGGELGLKLNFNNKLILDLATYYTYLNNALVRRDFTLNGESQIIYDGELSNVQAIQNASKAWIYGFEAGLEYNFAKNLKLSSQFSVIGGTEENNGIEVPVRHVAPIFGNSHLIWNTNAFTIDVFALYNSELSFNQLAPSEIGKDYLYALDENGMPYAPSWATLNIRTRYNLSPEFALTASLENITDQRYRPYSSGISAPGRNLIASIKYSF